MNRPRTPDHRCPSRRCPMCRPDAARLTPSPVMSDRLIRSIGYGHPSRDDVVPGQTWLTPVAPILPAMWATTDVGAAPDDGAPIDPENVPADDVTATDVTDDGAPVERLSRRTIRTAGPWERLAAGITRDPRGNVILPAHVNGEGKLIPARMLPAPRRHRENVAWCTSCGAVATSSPAIVHAATCTGAAPVGCHIPRAIDGPSATAAPRYVTRAAMTGTGANVRPEPSPELESRGQHRTRTSAGTANRSRVTVGALSVHGHHAIRMGTPVPWLTDANVPDRIRAAAAAHRADMAAALERAAHAITVGIGNGRYGTWLTDGAPAPAVIPVAVLNDGNGQGSTGTWQPWHPPMVAGAAVRYVGGGQYVTWLTMADTLITATGTPRTAGWHTHTPVGAPAWNVPVADHATVRGCTVDVTGDGAVTARFDRDGHPMAVRWIAPAPATALSPDVAGYGYVTPSPVAAARAAATVRSLTATAARARRVPAVPYVPATVVHAGIGRAVTAKGAPVAPRKVTRRRSRQAILTATAAPAPVVAPDVAAAARAMVDGGAIG